MEFGAGVPNAEAPIGGGLGSVASGFVVDDDRVTDWSEVGVVPAGESREAWEVWEIAAGSEVVHYVVSNWLEHPGVYRVDLSAGAVAGRR